MKTPDEIKKGLKACGDGCCSACTYWDDCDPDDHHVALVTDALAYIAQLEANQAKWNSPKDKFPDVPMFYAITKYNADPKIYRKNLVDPDYTSEWLNIRNEILWWIPIPEVPKEDTK